MPPYKRKTSGEIGFMQNKPAKPIFPAYFIPDLAHVVAMCDEKIPFINLAQTLSKHNVPHCGVQIETNAIAIILRIICFPKPTPRDNRPVIYLFTYSKSVLNNNQFMLYVIGLLSRY